MLPFGALAPRPGYEEARQTKLTHDEQRTVMTLWSMLRSPLILGANLTKLDDWTLSLLTNPEVLSLDGASHGARQVTRDPGQVVWISHPDAGAGLYLALFNLTDTQRPISYPLQSLGGTVSFKVRDLWEHKDLGSIDTLRITVPPHGSKLYRLQ